MSNLDNFEMSDEQKAKEILEDEIEETKKKIKKPRQSKLTPERIEELKQMRINNLKKGRETSLENRRKARMLKDLEKEEKRKEANKKIVNGLESDEIKELKAELAELKKSLLKDKHSELDKSSKPKKSEPLKEVEEPSEEEQVEIIIEKKKKPKKKPKKIIKKIIYESDDDWEEESNTAEKNIQTPKQEETVKEKQSPKKPENKQTEMETKPLTSKQQYTRIRAMW